ncbi:Response regulator [Azospirillaceae bacterium]
MCYDADACLYGMQLDVMAAEYDLSSVESYLFDPQPNTMRLMRDMMSRLGLKATRVIENVNDMYSVANTRIPDLLVIDAENTESEVFRLLRYIRGDPASHNPFMSLIVTTWQPTNGLLNKVTSCGGDDLLIKPASPKQMMERVTSLIENRRRFVVTADYVGPERRKSPRPGRHMPLIEVPNTLRLKAFGHWDNFTSRHIISKAVEEVNNIRLSRCAVQIGFLVEFALPGLASELPDRVSLEHLFRIPPLGEDILHRLGDSPRRAKIEPALRLLIGIVEYMRAHAETHLAARALEKLHTQTCEVMHLIDPDRPLEEIMGDVQDFVSNYRERLEEFVAAKAAAAAFAAASAEAGSVAPSNNAETTPAAVETPVAADVSEVTALADAISESPSA